MHLYWKVLSVNLWNLIWVNIKDYKSADVKTALNPKSVMNLCCFYVVCIWICFCTFGGCVKMALCYNCRFSIKGIYVFVCVYAHSGRRQGRCFEQRAAEHQATSGGDGGGEETTGGGDSSGNICPLFILTSLTWLSSVSMNYRPDWSIGSIIFAVKAFVYVTVVCCKNRNLTQCFWGNTACVSSKVGLMASLSLVIIT